jgi:hypothetical protein
MDVHPEKVRLDRVIWFTLFYIAVASVVCWTRGNGEFIFYIVIMALVMAGVVALHRRVGLSIGLLWCLSIWGLLHMAGGLMPIPETWPRGGGSAVLYNLWVIPGQLKFDQVVHAYGFGITTWLCWQALRARVRSEDGGALRPTFGVLLLCAAGGMGFGALNEVVEFVATLTLEETNVGGYRNTGWDLVANLVGCAVAAVVIYFGRERG